MPRLRRTYCIRFKFLFLIGVYLAFTIGGVAIGMIPAGHSMPVVTCPFMHDLDSLCQMNIAYHMDNWMLLFSAILPALLIMLAIRESVVDRISAMTLTPQQQRYRRYARMVKPFLRYFQLNARLYSRRIIQKTLYA
ncbi:hypothetical protein HYV71_02305 [Candidatus Uhrbacteria bacterium]|nr:hypothetical protein [Candidatus Uhrbacteria bacterium]